jgi:putative radical SAM enzyme (TIGR03279 family)
MYEFAVAPAVTNIQRRGVVISSVEPQGLGNELEMEPGDRITRVNGRLIRDYLDFRFHTSGETELQIEIKKHSGEIWELEVERDEGEDFGVTFEQIVPRQCANECIFCFCNGNPVTARPSLFIKDEDVRLSFLYGNYTTLTSITEDEMRRIVEQRLTPQYVSVHATDLAVRAYLLGVSQKRADISSKLRRLLDAQIEVHAQVVLCPNINDGEILERTISDLASDYPRIRSVAIVPLGLTQYNTDPRLTPVTKEFCQRTIAEMRPIQRELRKRLGTTFAYLGDEIYLKAGDAIPGRKHYGNYPQIEDGIGMVRAFKNSFARTMRRLAREPLRNPQAIAGTLITGTLFGPELQASIDLLNSRSGTNLHVVAVENKYFGGDVSVAGLLTGSDILAAQSRIRGSMVFIPKAVLKSDEEIFLDGMTLSDLRSELHLWVEPVDVSSFANALYRQSNLIMT